MLPVNMFAPDYGRKWWLTTTIRVVVALGLVLGSVTGLVALLIWLWEKIT